MPKEVRPEIGKPPPERPTRLLSRLRNRLFHLYFLLSRPMTMGVRGLVHDRAQGTVLLVRHTYVEGWHLPGGGIEADETAVNALRRELIEEANVELTEEPALVSVHYNRRASRRDHVLLYLVETFHQTSKPEPTREIAEARFFRLDDLPTDISPSSAKRIREVLDGADRADHW